jgi:hypothetical protein
MKRFGPERVWRWGAVSVTAVCGLGLIAALAGCSEGRSPASTAASAEPANPEALDTVECRLPVEVERLGRQVTKLGPSQVVRVSRKECIARKGEVIPATGAPGSAPAR